MWAVDATFFCPVCLFLRLRHHYKLHYQLLEVLKVDFQIFAAEIQPLIKKKKS